MYKIEIIKQGDCYIEEIGNSSDELTLWLTG